MASPIRSPKTSRQLMPNPRHRPVRSRAPPHSNTAALRVLRHHFLEVASFRYSGNKAKARLVHRYPVVGAADARSVYADGLDALVVQVDSARGRGRRPAGVLARHQRAAHELLALFALHVVAVPAGAEEHDLSGA